MAGKKKAIAKKKVVKTKKVTKPKAGEKKQIKKSVRKVTPQKGKTISVKTVTTKKVSAKAPQTKKKPQTKTSGDKTLQKKSSTAAKAGIKKKLSPREKLIQEIRKKLVSQRTELLTEAEEALNMLPGQTIFPDMGDQASAEIDRSFMLRLRGREQRLLKKIDQAIEKIENGTFGICEVCGEEIEAKRLDARPVATMCIFCKTEQEEEEKLRGA